MTTDNYEAASSRLATPMKVKDALPRIFQRAYPVLDPQTKMLSAMSLLRFQEIDALPLSFEPGERRQRAVFGSSSLARLILVRPEQLGSFLERPCTDASEPIATVRATQDLATLLETFAETRFGFARVEERTGVGALASLTDVMELYETGAIATGLTVKDVGTPIFSMPGEASLRKALQEMFRKRFRRVFVSGSRRFISDREMIGHVFSPGVLGAILQKREGPKEVLEIPVSEVKRVTAKEVRPETPLKEAARALRSERRGQCLVFDHTVVTPWDVVMKPWVAGELELETDLRDGGPRSR
jgi:CBS domain-containing protein